MGKLTFSDQQQELQNTADASGKRNPKRTLLKLRLVSHTAAGKTIRRTLLSLTTTLDCNLGCYYCYEDRSEAHLDATSAADVVSWTRSRLLASGKKTLHVDWYGGEPLLSSFTVLERSKIGLWTGPHARKLTT
jgi:sulfatase maturation enzyme AslB (radical SAM superfamily)